MYQTDGHMSTITLSNEGGSKANKLFGNKMIRKEKEDKPKVYNVSEKFIVTDTDNKAMISNATIYSKKNILNDTINNEVTVSNKSEVDMFQTAGHGSTITLSNEGGSKANKLFGNKMIRKEKEDKPKVYNVSNKYFHSVDSVSIKDSKIPGTSMFATAGRRKSIFISNEGILNANQLSGSKTPLQSHLSQQPSSSHSLPDSITNNSTIGFDCKVSKEQTSQSISKDLIDSSFEANGFVYDLPIKDDHCELQK